jgi:hypothetical protein
VREMGSTRCQRPLNRSRERERRGPTRRGHMAKKEVVGSDRQRSGAAEVSGEARGSAVGGGLTHGLLWVGGRWVVVDGLAWAWLKRKEISIFYFFSK